MTKDGWKLLIHKCADDAVATELLAQLLEEVDKSRQLLIDSGYGCTGMSLMKMIETITSS